MGWAALYRRPPILRGVSASQIRADHAANQARIDARYGPALPSSLRLRGEADAAHHSAVISHARGVRSPISNFHDSSTSCLKDVASGEDRDASAVLSIHSITRPIKAPTIACG